MAKTSIEWTDESSNPIAFYRKDNAKRGWACVKKSAGCANCYSERMNKRLGTGLPFTVPAMEQVEAYLEYKEMKRLSRLKAPRKIFMCDMTDLFGDFVPFWMIEQIFYLMMRQDGQTFQVLTKRPERMRDLIQGNKDFHNLTNVWLGVSAEDQNTADERIPYLLQTPAAVRFVSCEPLLGPVNLAVFDCTNAPIHWIIAGGESGPGARPMHPDWARGLRDQCQAAGVPFFFKQWGEWLPQRDNQNKYALENWKNGEINAPLIHPVHDSGFFTFNDKTKMNRIGKKSAGRLLDGREWSEFPQVQP